MESKWIKSTRTPPPFSCHIEVQNGSDCGKHAINNLLCHTGRSITSRELSDISRELDIREAKMLGGQFVHSKIASNSNWTSDVIFYALVKKIPAGQIEIPGRQFNMFCDGYILLADGHYTAVLSAKGPNSRYWYMQIDSLNGGRYRWLNAYQFGAIASNAMKISVMFPYKVRQLRAIRIAYNRTIEHRPRILLR